MIFVKGYKNVGYLTFKELLSIKLKKSGKKNIDLATSLELSSPETIRVVFKRETQTVSDTVLTKLMNTLKVDGFVLWNKGIRYYYIKSKAI